MIHWTRLLLSVLTIKSTLMILAPAAAARNISSAVAENKKGCDVESMRG